MLWHFWEVVQRRSTISNPLPVFLLLVYYPWSSTPVPPKVHHNSTIHSSWCEWSAHLRFRGRLYQLSRASPKARTGSFDTLISDLDQVALAQREAAPRLKTVYWAFSIETLFYLYTDQLTFFESWRTSQWKTAVTRCSRLKERKKSYSFGAEQRKNENETYVAWSKVPRGHVVPFSLNNGQMSKTFWILG